MNALYFLVLFRDFNQFTGVIQPLNYKLMETKLTILSDFTEYENVCYILVTYYINYSIILKQKYVTKLHRVTSFSISGKKKGLWLRNNYFTKFNLQPSKSSKVLCFYSVLIRY